jgi:hypothetical protein
MTITSPRTKVSYKRFLVKCYHNISRNTDCATGLYVTDIPIRCTCLKSMSVLICLYTYFQSKFRLNILIFLIYLKVMALNIIPFLTF